MIGDYVGKTNLLDDEPLRLVTTVGVETWRENGIEFSQRFDRVPDPHTGELKYRCLCKKEGEGTPYVLVVSPDDNGGTYVVLFDERPDV